MFPQCVEPSTVEGSMVEGIPQPEGFPENTIFELCTCVRTTFPGVMKLWEGDDCSILSQVENRGYPRKMRGGTGRGTRRTPLL